MAILPIVDLSGNKVGDFTLPAGFFEREVNRHVLNEVVRAQRAARRSGSACVKNRAAVRGSSKKMGKQKGSGGARHGTKRAPSFVGGGVVHGPQPRSYAFQVPKKVRALALEAALTVKIRRGECVVVQSWSGVTHRTQELAKTLAALGCAVDRGALLVDAEVSPALGLASRNLPKVQALPSLGANVFDMLRRQRLVVTEAGFSALCARLERHLSPRQETAS